MATLSNKKLRQEVYEKCNGHCGYCGSEIDIKQMHVDHIQPKQRGWNEEAAAKINLVKGRDEIENFMPACKRCNLWKKTFSVDSFRREIELQTERLMRDKPGYRLALDFGLIKEEVKPVVFYFELLQIKAAA